MSYSNLLQDNSITSPSGHFICKKPSLPYQTANKQYVDDSIAGIPGGESEVTNPMTSDLDANYQYNIINISQTETESLYTHNIYKSTGTEINIHDPLHMTNNKITHMAVPTNDSDAATKKYVDDKIITVNSSISNNTSAINTNISNITNNTNAINSLQNIVSSNTTQIDNNTNEITTNTTDIHTYNKYDMIIAVTDETTPIAVGNNQVKIRTPRAFSLTGIKASLSTAQTGGTSLLTVDVKQNGTSIFNTLLTFDDNTETTVVATTPCVLTSNPLPIVSDAVISVDVTQIGNGTAKGLKIDMLGKL